MCLLQVTRTRVHDKYTTDNDFIHITRRTDVNFAVSQRKVTQSKFEEYQLEMFGTDSCGFVLAICTIAPVAGRNRKIFVFTNHNAKDRKTS